MPSQWKNKRLRRRGAAKSIQAAWRRKKRAKTSLMQRTVLQNRRAVKKLASAVEIKVIDNVIANSGNSYSGQQFRQTQCNNEGEDGAGNALVWRPLRGMGVGTDTNQRIGECCTLQCLAYKIEFKATSGALPVGTDEYSMMGCYVVLDTKPTAGALNSPNLCGSNWASATTNAGQLMHTPIAITQTTPSATMAFLNRNLVSGPNPRFKILRHHQVKLQPYAQDGAVFPPVKVIKGNITSKYKVRYPEVQNPPTGAELVPTNYDLCFFFYSDSGAIPNPTVSGCARYYFRDA